MNAWRQLDSGCGRPGADIIWKGTNDSRSLQTIYSEFVLSVRRVSLPSYTHQPPGAAVLAEIPCPYYLLLSTRTACAGGTTRQECRRIDPKRGCIPAVLAVSGAVRWGSVVYGSREGLERARIHARYPVSKGGKPGGGRRLDGRPERQGPAARLHCEQHAHH